MGYSLRVPLPGGLLKIKSESRLRTRERDREVPVFDFLGVFFIWQADGAPRRAGRRT